MSFLASQLCGLFKLARRRHSPQCASLSRGLSVRVHHREQRLFIWREQGKWGPGEAAEREGYACAKALGWTGYALRWQGRYLIVEAAPTLLECAP